MRSLLACAPSLAGTSEKTLLITGQIVPQVVKMKFIMTGSLRRQQFAQPHRPRVGIDQHHVRDRIRTHRALVVVVAAVAIGPRAPWRRGPGRRLDKQRAAGDAVDGQHARNDVKRTFMASLT